MTSTIIFAGGGSGGHLFPALAIAEQVRLLADQAALPQPRLLFLCSDRPLDATILKHAGVSLVVSPAKPAVARPSGLASFFAGWVRASGAGRRLFRDAKKLGPVHVCALGGFVAAPAVSAANAEGVDVTMVNLDGVPGRANRWIAPRSRRVFTAARVVRRPAGGPQWEEIPPIVRRGASSHCRAESRENLAIKPDRSVLVVTGGSQGLRSLNDFATAFAESADGQETLVARRWHVLHQTGRGAEEAVRGAYHRAGVEATVAPFTDAMADWWGAADAALATAGAGNVAEVWCNHVPTLFLPYPHHRDRHQRFNPRPLEEAGGAFIGEDRIDPRANLKANAATLALLLGDPARRRAMRESLERLGPADGAARVASALLDSVNSPQTAAIH